MWEVHSCRQHAKGADHQAWRVQRWCQDGFEGAYEMAFIHGNKELCLAVAGLLNGSWYHNAEGIQIKIGAWGNDDSPRVREPESEDPGSRGSTSI